LAISSTYRRQDCPPVFLEWKTTLPVSNLIDPRCSLLTTPNKARLDRLLVPKGGAIHAEAMLLRQQGQLYDKPIISLPRSYSRQPHPWTHFGSVKCVWLCFSFPRGDKSKVNLSLRYRCCGVPVCGASSRRGLRHAREESGYRRLERGILWRRGATCVDPEQAHFELSPY
jgi:hypothetical protein